MIIDSGFAEITPESLSVLVEEKREGEHVVFKEEKNPLLIIVDRLSYTMQYV